MKAINWLCMAALAGVTVCPWVAAEEKPAEVKAAETKPAENQPAVDKEAQKAFLEQAKEQLVKTKLEEAAAAAKAEAKPEGKPEVKPEGKVEAKPEVKPEVKAEAPAKTEPEVPIKKPLDKNVLKLIETFTDLQKQIYANRDRNHIYQFFDLNYELLKLLPEFVYLGKETRLRLAAENKELAAYFKTNAKSIALLEDLAGTFQQRLGLEGVKIAVPRKMTGAAPPPAKVTADIDLSGEGVAEGPKDVSREMTQTDRYMVAVCEDHLKRLATYRARQSFQECERDWQGVLDNMAGAYYFQLIVQQDPRYGLTYPEMLKFLQTMKNGPVKIPVPGEATAAAAKPTKPEREPRPEKTAERHEKPDPKAH